MDDRFMAANLNSALARPGHQPTVATGSFLAARLAPRGKQERTQNPAAAAIANQSDKLPSRLIWSLMAGTR